MIIKDMSISMGSSNHYLTASPEVQLTILLDGSQEDSDFLNNLRQVFNAQTSYNAYSNQLAKFLEKYQEYFNKTEDELEEYEPPKDWWK